MQGFWPAARWLSWQSVRAQTVVLGPEGVERSQGLGQAFQTFSIFGGTPGVAAARFYSDFDLNNFQLPIAHTFAPFDSDFLSGVAPYAEVTLDYLTADQTFPLTPGPTAPNSVKLTLNAWSVLAGGGLDVPLGNGFRLRPIVLAGYSHVGGDADFFGPNSARLRLPGEWRPEQCIGELGAGRGRPGTCLRDAVPGRSDVEHKGSL